MLPYQPAATMDLWRPTMDHLEISDLRVLNTVMDNEVGYLQDWNQAVPISGQITFSGMKTELNCLGYIS